MHKSDFFENAVRIQECEGVADGSTDLRIYGSTDLRSHEPDERDDRPQAVAQSDA